jgi:hypothetical protein
MVDFLTLGASVVAAGGGGASVRAGSGPRVVSPSQKGAVGSCGATAVGGGDLMADDTA